MEKDILSKFLGCEPDEGLEKPDEFTMFTYKSNKLVYGFSLDLKEKVIGVSADFNMPFNYACIAEVVAEYDQIGIEHEPQFYGDDEILVCRKNYPHQKGVATLKIKKWKDGELSIWMSRSIESETNYDS